MILQEVLQRITPADRTAASRCRARWNSLGKPLYGLGELEELLVQIAAIQGTERMDIRKRGLVIFCADNGVVEEGVSQAGQEVTAIVAENFLDGVSSAAIMCRRTHTDILPVDVGMVTDTPRVEKRKVLYGTRNMAKGPAMTREEAVQNVETGIRKAGELKGLGYQILASGEMGIGNTTTSAAVTSVLLGKTPAEAAGRGAGLSDEGLARKVRAIERAIAVNRPDPSDPLDVLSKVGGLDIAALTGLFLGGALYHIPVIMDGFISAVAALLAVRMAPACRDYMLASHLSEEPSTRRVMEALGMHPVIHAGMHLGEGTGALCLFPLLDLAAAVYDGMDTFAGIAVEAYEDYGNRT